MMQWKNLRLSFDVQGIAEGPCDDHEAGMVIVKSIAPPSLPSPFRNQISMADGGVGDSNAERGKIPSSAVINNCRCQCQSLIFGDWLPTAHADADSFKSLQPSSDQVFVIQDQNIIQKLCDCGIARVGRFHSSACPVKPDALLTSGIQWCHLELLNPAGSRSESATARVFPLGVARHDVPIVQSLIDLSVILGNRPRHEVFVVAGALTDAHHRVGADAPLVGDPGLPDFRGHGEHFPIHLDLSYFVVI
jgi:hypothetical protein